MAANLNPNPNLTKRSNLPVSLTVTVTLPGALGRLLAAPCEAGRFSWRALLPALALALVGLVPLAWPLNIDPYHSSSPISNPSTNPHCNRNRDRDRNRN